MGQACQWHCAACVCGAACAPGHAGQRALHGSGESSKRGSGLLPGACAARLACGFPGLHAAAASQLLPAITGHTCAGVMAMRRSCLPHLPLNAWGMRTAAGMRTLPANGHYHTHPLGPFPLCAGGCRAGRVFPGHHHPPGSGPTEAQLASMSLSDLIALEERAAAGQEQQQPATTTATGDASARPGGGPAAGRGGGSSSSSISRGWVDPQTGRDVDRASVVPQPSPPGFMGGHR